jgi:hypothetical protein
MMGHRLGVLNECNGADRERLLHHGQLSAVQVTLVTLSGRPR